MTLREKLNNNPALAAVIVIAAALAVVLSFVLFGGRGGLPDVVRVYYYDLDRGELFTERTDRDAGAGRGRVVRAAVYGCDGCGPDDIFIGYLIDEEDRIRGLDAEQWHSPSSEAGLQIQEAPIQRCRQQGQRPRRCEPR